MLAAIVAICLFICFTDCGKNEALAKIISQFPTPVIIDDTKTDWKPNKDGHTGIIIYDPVAKAVFYIARNGGLMKALPSKYTGTEHRKLFTYTVDQCKAQSSCPIKTFEVDFVSGFSIKDDGTLGINSGTFNVGGKFAESPNKRSLSEWEQKLTHHVMTNAREKEDEL